AAENDVWPNEVKLIAEQIERIYELPPVHYRKVMQHINTMLLERQPSNSILIAAQALTETFGEHA
ncbi:phage N-6-adenine-methyltransferase, partial [Erwinia sp. INIA-01]|nr:phage N-6-adenine-methyltransferase [Erwinia sp. INIA01]